VSLAPFEFSHFFLSLLLQHLSWSSVNLPKLQVEVTRVWEAATTAEAARITAVLAAETSTQEATVELDSVATLVKDVEDRTALAEREAQERVSRVAAESTAALASGHEDVEGLAQKIALPEGELAEVRRA
jgi:hypothetical protein